MTQSFVRFPPRTADLLARLAKEAPPILAEVDGSHNAYRAHGDGEGYVLGFAGRAGEGCATRSVDEVERICNRLAYLAPARRVAAVAMVMPIYRFSPAIRVQSWEPRSTVPQDRKPANVPLPIGQWARDEEHPVFPVGSKPKRMIRCPDDAPTGCIPGHSYLFKIGEGWRGMQVWSEVIAYRIGSSVGLNVPPCQLAFDELNQEIGALVEFFYGYPDEKRTPRFFHASDLMPRQAVRDGRPHSVRFNLAICRLLGIADPVDWWARTLVFDALIGNTDRHLENWGLITERGDDGTRSFRLAPVFDNGTSLGYEVSESRLRAMCELDALDAYVSRGRHHCGWDMVDGQTQHTSLCRRLAAAFPGTSAAMQDVLNFDLRGLQDSLEEWTGLDIALPLTSQRVEFILALLTRRRAILRAAIGI